MLVTFEASCHPQYSHARVTGAMAILDSIVRSLSLTQLDTFEAGTTRFVEKPTPVQESMIVNSRTQSPHGCVCQGAMLAAIDPKLTTKNPEWNCALGYDPDWSLSAIRKDECRRLIWGSHITFIRHNADALLLGRPYTDFHIADSMNVRVPLIFSLRTNTQTIMGSSPFSFLATSSLTSTTTETGLTRKKSPSGGCTVAWP